MIARGTDIRLLIVDDHELVRDLVAAHLRAQGGFVVDTVPTLVAAQALMAREGVFDLILLDYALPDSRGLADSAVLIALNEGRPVVLFSGLARTDTVHEALAQGFAGFIPKSTPARTLADAIRRVLDGEVWMPDGLDDAPLPPRLSALTPREMEVLRDIRNGLMNKEIAGRMGLSEVTVKMHVRSICAKLKARNRTQAAMIAAELMP
jgi:DNA-binding NarL/FixJ family response regulator